MLNRIYVIFAFVAFSELFGVGNTAEFCRKLDFNKPQVQGLRECQNELLPMYSAKRYNENPAIKPFRPNSEFFLGNHLEGASCGETVEHFELNGNSTIDAAIYLWHQHRGAFIQLSVIDADKNEVVYTWRNESSKGWVSLTMKISQDIKNAVVSRCAQFSTADESELRRILFIG